MVGAVPPAPQSVLGLVNAVSFDVRAYRCQQPTDRIQRPIQIVFAKGLHVRPAVAGFADFGHETSLDRAEVIAENIVPARRHHPQHHRHVAFHVARGINIVGT